jgi:hypothetical protein
MAEARNEISQVAASIPRKSAMLVIPSELTVTLSAAWGDLCSPNDPYTQAHAGSFNTTIPA